MALAEDRQDDAGHRRRIILKAGDPFDLLGAIAKDEAEFIIYQNAEHQQPPLIEIPLETITPHEG